MAMICGELGVDYDFPNTAAYLADWLGKLRSDPREIFRAAADAQKIADYLLNFHPAFALAHTDEPPADVDHNPSARELAEAA